MAKPRPSSPSRSDRAPDDPQDPLALLRERLHRGVLVTSETIQESLDDAVRRGRLTRDDAQAMANDLVARGRRQAEDFLADVEELMVRGRTVAEVARRRVDRARRVAGLGSSLPVAGYEDLDAREVTRRLAGLSAPELQRVRDFERGHRNRKTVLRAVERRLG